MKQTVLPGAMVACAKQNHLQCATTSLSPPKGLSEVFLADPDGADFIVNTGTHKFIVNDLRLLKNFRPVEGKVKGMNRESTKFQGNRQLTLTLKSDHGDQIQIVVDLVVVPHCPYNLMSPQLLVHELKQQGISANCSFDNNKTHTIS